MIRRAEKKNMKRVNDLLRQVLTVHAEKRPDIFIPGTKKYRDDELAAIFADENTPVFVFTDEDDVTQGYAFCAFEETKDRNSMRDMKTLYIDDICVEEACRGRHIATELYRYVTEFAKAEGCDRITLNVWEVNPPARAFYEAMGMKPLKTVMEAKL